jgi:hypothetical protein
LHGLFNDRTGELGINNRGTPMKIIKYKDCSNIDVEFLDEYHYVKFNNTYVNFKNGVICNPYDKIVYGVGYLGDGKYKTGTSKAHTLAYAGWYEMIRRCYSKNKKKFPTYSGICTTCEEWHNYQNFAKWFDDNYIDTEERLHLDKDILIPGNKEYSPDKCLLVPQRINMLFLNKPNKRGLPNGIWVDKYGRYRAEYNGYMLGAYDDILDAFEIYAKEKEEAIKSVAEEYKNMISLKLYNALLNHKVKIENDKNYVV